MALASAGAGAVPAQFRASDTIAFAADMPPALPAPLLPDAVASKPDYQAATHSDRMGRVMVPVMVNERGPFLFVLDTGANRTVLTQQLLAALGLQNTAGKDVTMNGATGSAIVPTAMVERVAAGDVVLSHQQLPVARGLANGIDGILGVDALEAKRVMVDFTSGKIEIRNARRERPIVGAERIPAQLRFGRLMVVDARVDRIRVKAVIDTGSEYTLGNDALRVALYESERARSPKPPVDVLGETLAVQSGERHPVTTLFMGDVRADHFNIVFGDFFIFSLWGLNTKPALVIGMDLFSKLDVLVIDYERREVQLRVPLGPSSVEPTLGKWE